MSWTDGTKANNGKPTRYQFDADDYAGFRPFGEWLDAEKAKAESQPTSKTMTAAAVAKRLETVNAALKQAHLKSTAAEWQSINDAAKALLATVYGMQSDTDDLDESVLTPPALAVPGGTENQPVGGKKGHKQHASAGRKAA